MRAAYPDWHLASKDEWQALTGAANNFSSDWNLPTGHPFTSAQDFYWTSTEYDTFNAWLVTLSSGYVSLNGKTNARCAWAVR